MNFVRDLELVAQEELDRYGIDSPKCLGREIVRMFVNLNSRLIPVVPRKVARSQCVQRMIDDENFDKEIKHSIKQIETKIRNGEDLNPHLSTSIKAGNFTDRLLADWNIYHL